VTDYEVAVAGGGCVGLSTARHLAETDVDVAVLEKEYRLAAHQSGRNSGVLHPGFNYPPGSRKARFATEGTRRMKAFCRERGVPLDEVGVVVVAQSDAEERRLRDLADNADENGVDVELLDRDGLREREPYAEGQAALYCPEAASVDSQAYVYALAADARAAGVDLHLGYEVRGASPTADGLRVETDKGDVTADYLVNATGLHADRLAHELGVGGGHRVVPFRGEYYEVVPGRRDICRSMIYPTPDPDLPFLGVHFTRRADGKVIVGPNAVLAFGREAYRNTEFDLRDLADTLSYPGFWRLMASRKMLGVARHELAKSYRKDGFVAAARRLVPDVTADDLVESYAGVRAQLVSADGNLVQDPVFETGPRSLHVLNAVSPGLTSSLPLGDHLADRVLEGL
jgi:L-2-hydroxyglutarate oxidase LhgO